MSDHLFRVYVSQHGSMMETILSAKDTNTLYDAILKHGSIVQVWQSTGTATTGITVDPRAGGCVLHMETAVPVIVDAQGNPTADPRLAAGQVDPAKLPRGKVIVPPWATRTNGRIAVEPIEPPSPGAEPPVPE